MSTLQTQEIKNNLKIAIEKTAEHFVMSDLSDSSVLEKMADALFGISGDLNKFYPRCSIASVAAGDLLRRKARGDQNLSESDLQILEKTISALQELASKDIEEHELDFPESIGLANPSRAFENFREDKFTTDCPWVDADIMEEYIAQQESVVSEIEDLVLSYEQHQDNSILKQLKRLLHTAKGEAGVVGLNLIEKVCHQVEDYIQEQSQHIKADLLLQFKDWYEQTVVAIKNQEQFPETDNLIRALQESTEYQAKNLITVETLDSPQQSLLAENDFSYLLAPLPIEDPEITADFISETHEHFEISDENLLILEKDPENEEAIACIFRAFHTIKGTTSFIGLTPLSELAHKAENLLDEVRKKRLHFTGPVVDATFNAFDCIKTMIKQLEKALIEGKPFIPDPGLPAAMMRLEHAMSGSLSGTSPEKNQDDSLQGFSRETKYSGSGEYPANQLPESDSQHHFSEKPVSQCFLGKAVKQTMKIDADRIDLLLETIGELVIVESIVTREATIRRSDSRDMERNLAQLTKITRSLQDLGMSMRLIPIDNTFRKMARLVRDLARKTGKQIELIVEGKDTELDKSMVEKLGDPLIHMIRNAVDHGIEATIDERIAAGKNPVGRILLRAYHQGGNIHIDISDDGKGLNKEIIASRAMERGIISSLEHMPDEDIYALIFQPGFSTAKQVTDVSGRGVGMDVVKNNIESIRGNVRIASEIGKGTTFTLVLPLTMAIIDGMIVRVGSERYILPLLAIIESFQPLGEMISTVIGKGETVPFRNKLLPIFRLADLFNIANAQTDPTQALLVVIEDSERQMALLVDELLGQNQTVIKNLGEGLGNVDGIAGASIMPDGKPGLIIDVNGLFKMAM